MDSLRHRLGKMILDGMVTLLDICPNCQLTSSLTKNIADWLLAAEHLGKSNIYLYFYTANFYPMKTSGAGNCRVPAGKSCTINGKGLQELRENPGIIIGPVITTGFPCNAYSPFP